MKLGEKIENMPLGSRDAVHVAVILVSCETNLFRGESVRFVDEAFTKVGRCNADVRHGIADPFSSVDIEPGKPFLVMLCPEVVGQLTHKFDVNVSAVDDRNKVAPWSIRDDDDEDKCDYSTC